MLFTIISLLTILCVGADVAWFLCRTRRQAGKTARRIFVVWIALTDALPFVVTLVSTFSRDNDRAFMAFAMWMFFAWMVTVLPRMVFYLFALIGLPRLGIAAGIALTALFAWGATAGRTRLIVNRVEVRSERLPEAFAGFRIVQLSDIHIGSLVCPAQELQRLVERVNALEPDLIVFCGDLVNIRSTELDQRAMQLLGGLKAPYGVVSVMGNHDVGGYIRDTAALSPETSRAQVVERQRAMGWRLLEDSTIYLHRGADSICVTGISFAPALQDHRHAWDLPPTDLEKPYEGVPAQTYNITAAHLPQLWDRIRERGRGDLTLAGHVHSMQVKVKLWGWAWSPARWLYDRWSGRYDQDGSTLYINDGTGYVAYPMRLGANPEITLVTLEK